VSVRIVIADDQALVRAGLRKLFEVDPTLEVVAEAGSGREVVECVRALRPDVVVMDIRMPDVDGLVATKQLAEVAPETRVLILTTFGLDEYVYEALRAGASGFLLKDSPAEDLLAGVRIVARGDALLDPSITRAVIEQYARAPRRRDDLTRRLDELTAREREVLGLLARGLSNAEIAAELVVGDGTVKTHVARVLQKLDLRDRVQAVVYAYEAGVVEAGTS
jgi:DNA-binding NarL/FixJ family response regulator